MFERLCALLFRLYPLEFRRAYGRDAWQLIQDRARVERGLSMRTRLLLDLLRDLLATSMRGWHPNPALMAAADVRDGTPRFHMIEVRPRRPEWYVAGMLSSMVMFASFTLLFHPQNFPSAPAQLGEGDGSIADAADAPFDPRQQPLQQVTVDPAAERRKIIEAVAANLKEHYVDRTIGQQLSNALLAQEKNRDFESVHTGPELAERLTNRIHEMSRALGVPAGASVADVMYSDTILPAGPPPPTTMTMTPERLEQARIAMQRQNCYFQTIKILPNDIGYLELLGFPNVEVCADTTRQVMTAINNARAVIIDLRGNRGGFGETALQIAGYFFTRPTFLWDPRPHTIVPAETASPVASNRLADKPVYLLTSSTTASAAEYFAYNLKMLKRATIVGERTAGQQHSGVFRRITDHIGMGIQEESPAPNPFAIKGWETIGVEPDVKVSRAEALETARKLAASKVSSVRPR